MKQFPKIKNGAFAEHAKAGNRAFDENNASLMCFYNKMYSGLWEQYKTCVEVTNWIYIAKKLGPPTLLTGLSGYSFYGYLKNLQATNKDEGAINKQSTGLEFVKQKLEELFNTSTDNGDGIKNSIKKVMLHYTGMSSINFLVENKDNILGAIKGLCFSLSSAWLAYEIKNYDQAKKHAQAYLLMFSGNETTIEHLISNLAEYMTARFAPLVNSISNEIDIKNLSTRFLKQFAYSVGKGKPTSLLTQGKIILCSNFELR